MRIHSIEIQGLWAYRDVVSVELDGLPLVVAVGQNGAGKSALVVSSVLVALYGKFPTTTADESISSGMESGSVALEFSIGATRYRVSRRFSRGKASSTASLHKMVGDEWKAVTEKGPREVTAKIGEILGMPFETAVMTWVAEQGDYGKFATAKPAQRFSLLAGVYGLDKYTPLLKTARERLRAHEDRAAQLEGKVIELTDGMVEDDETEREGLAALSDDQLSAQSAADHKALDVALAELAAHNQSSPTAALAKAEAAFAAVRDARLAQLAAAELALATARENRSRAQQDHDVSVQNANESYAGGTAALAVRTQSARREISERVESAEESINSLEGESKQLAELRRTHEESVARAAASRALITAASSAQTQIAVRLAHLSSESESIKARLSEATTALAALHDASECQTCGQHLAADVLQTLRATQQSAVADLSAQLENGASEVEKLQAEDLAQQTIIDSETASQSIAEETASRLSVAVASAERATNEVAQLRAQTVRDQARLVELVAEEASESERMTATRDAHFSQASERLTTELAAIKVAGESAAAQVNSTRHPSDAETALELECASARAAAANDEASAEAEVKLTATRDVLRARVAALDTETGRRAEVARRALEQGTRIEKAKADLTAAKKAVRVATDLVAAYSPSGIPTMILESVIDDLSAAVNAVLSNLSRGELMVRISTSRETATGSQEPRVTVYVETGTGTRAYEALSGGQRFRVDLAIRMGLATVVARGTGTPIETFILDEGWGTLDEAGIRSTLSVLHSLSEQVNVLTVSHIDSVRDAFPARIEITSTEGTSDALVVAG